jgi:hypothetical protein
MQPRKPVWKTSSFLVYSGGLTVLFAAIAALGYLSGHYGKGALTGWALLVLVILRFIAEALRPLGRWVAAGIFAFASVIAWGILVGVAWSWFGWLDNWHSAFGGWSLAHLSLEFLILVAALGDQFRWRFPFLALISTVVGWFFVTDFISNGGTWTYVVTLAIGLLYLLAGFASRSPSAFWLHFVGGLLIGVPLLRWWHTTDFQSRWWRSSPPGSRTPRSAPAGRSSPRSGSSARRSTTSSVSRRASWATWQAEPCRPT